MLNYWWYFRLCNHSIQRHVNLLNPFSILGHYGLNLNASRLIFDWEFFFQLQYCFCIFTYIFIIPYWISWINQKLTLQCPHSGPLSYFMHEAILISSIKYIHITHTHNFMQILVFNLPITHFIKWTEEKFWMFVTKAKVQSLQTEGDGKRFEREEKIIMRNVNRL